MEDTQGAGSNKIKNDIEDDSGNGSDVGELAWDCLSVGVAEDIDELVTKEFDLETDIEFDSNLCHSFIKEKFCDSALTFDQNDMNYIEPSRNQAFSVGRAGLNSTRSFETTVVINHHPQHFKNYFTALHGCYGYGYNHHGYYRHQNENFRSNYICQPPSPPQSSLNIATPCDSFEIGVWGDGKGEKRIQLEYNRTCDSTVSSNSQTPLPFIGNFEIGVWNDADMAENYRSRRGYVLTSLMESEKYRIDQEIANREKILQIGAEGSIQVYKPKSYDAFPHYSSQDSAYFTNTVTSSNNESYEEK